MRKKVSFFLFNRVSLFYYAFKLVKNDDDERKPPNQNEEKEKAFPHKSNLFLNYMYISNDTCTWTEIYVGCHLFIVINQKHIEYRSRRVSSMSITIFLTTCILILRSLFISFLYLNLSFYFERKREKSFSQKYFI